MNNVIYLNPWIARYHKAIAENDKDMIEYLYRVLKAARMI